MISRQQRRRHAVAKLLLRSRQERRPDSCMRRWSLTFIMTSKISLCIHVTHIAFALGSVGTGSRMKKHVQSKCPLPDDQRGRRTIVVPVHARLARGLFVDMSSTNIKTICRQSWFLGRWYSRSKTWTLHLPRGISTTTTTTTP